MAKEDDRRRVRTADDVLLSQWVGRLQKGEAGPRAEGISRRIVHDFVTRVHLDQPQSKITLAWLAQALEQIFAGTDPKIALRLPARAANRPKGKAATKAIDVAWWVKLAVDRGLTEPEANRQAAAVFSCDPVSIRRLRKEAYGWVEDMNELFDWDTYFAKKHRPLPPRKQRSKKRGR